MRRGFNQKELYHLAPLSQYRRKRHYLVLKRQQINCIWKCLFNISTEANIVDPDQTAPVGVVWSVSTLVVYEASNMDDKNIHFVIMRFKG